MINEQTRIQDPNDISYVYNGYSPLSVKFIETIFYSGGFAKLEKEDSNNLFIKSLLLEMKQIQGPCDYPANEGDFFGNKQIPAGLIIDQSKKRRVLVYFIGGITYGEIAAIRFLNKLFTDRKFIIATTQIINGDACIEMLRGQINNRLNPNSLLQK